MKEPSLQDWKDAMARFILYRMKAMGITMEDLAGASGLPLDYVRRVVNGDGIYPTHKARGMMATALGCSLEYVKPGGLEVKHCPTCLLQGKREMLLFLGDRDRCGACGWLGEVQ